MGRTPFTYIDGVDFERKSSIGRHELSTRHTSTTGYFKLISTEDRFIPSVCKININICLHTHNYTHSTVI